LDPPLCSFSPSSFSPSSLDPGRHLRMHGRAPPNARAGASESTGYGLTLAAPAAMAEFPDPLAQKGHDRWVVPRMGPLSSLTDPWSFSTTP